VAIVTENADAAKAGTALDRLDAAMLAAGWSLDRLFAVPSLAAPAPAVPSSSGKSPSSKAPASNKARTTPGERPKKE